MKRKGYPERITNRGKEAGVGTLFVMPRTGAILLAGFASLLAAQCAARHIVVPTMPTSPFADTEITTNAVLRTPGFDVRDLNLRIRLDGTPTNNLEVAFGRDADTNGVLDVSEIDVVYGWRAGRYFIENVRGWERIETEAVTNAVSCVFDIRILNAGGGAPKSFSAVCGGTAAFETLAANPPPAWLYRAEWDMVRAVRRGAGGASEWIDCEVDNHPFSIRLR